MDNTRGARQLNRPTSLVSAVVSDLINRVAAGEFDDTAKLTNETTLGKEYGVSRPVVREALRTLGDKGLITVRQGRGTQINPRDEWDLVDPEVLAAIIGQEPSPGMLSQLIAVRAAIEGEMARAMASNLTDETAANLKASFEKLEQYRDDVEKYCDADKAFHKCIMRSAGNSFGWVIVRKVTAWSRSAPRPLGYLPEEVDVSLAGHRRVYEAIAARDPSAAAEEMRNHILEAWQTRLKLNNL